VAAVYEYFPFDSGQGANSTESRWREMMSRMKSTGVVVEGSQMDSTADNMAVSGGSGMAVEIAPGKAWVQGHMFIHSGTSAVLPINSNTSGVTRTDLVVLRCDFVNNIMEYQILQGTLIPVQNANVWDLPLASVLVPNNADDSIDFTITDRRAFATPNAVVPSVRRYFSGALILTHNMYTNINLSSGFDWQTTDLMYPGTDVTRVVIPQDGFYQLSGRATMKGSSGSPSTVAPMRLVRIMVNGTSISTIQRVYGGAGAVDITCSTVERLFAGDYLQLQGFHDCGTGITVELSSAQLTAHYLGPIEVA
jgi:hypothetical protein